MKNILARGGIEFLAVLFGITISLWVEDWRENKDIQIKIAEDYINIKQEVEIDIENIENIILSIEEQINSLKKLIQYNEKKRVSESCINSTWECSYNYSFIHFFVHPKLLFL
jgi:hypothetical protein